MPLEYLTGETQGWVFSYTEQELFLDKGEEKSLEQLLSIFSRLLDLEKFQLLRCYFAKFISMVL